MKTRESSATYASRLIDALRRANGLSVLALSRLSDVGRSNLAKYLNRDPLSYLSEEAISSCLEAMGWTGNRPNHIIVHRWSFPYLDDDVVFLFGHALGGKAKVTTVRQVSIGDIHPKDGLIVADFRGAKIFVSLRRPKPKEDIVGKPTLDMLLRPEFGLTTRWDEDFIIPAPAYSELQYQDIQPERFDELVVDRRSAQRFEFAKDAADVLRALQAEGMTDQELATWLQDIRTLRTRERLDELLAHNLKAAREDFNDKHWWNVVMRFDESYHRDLLKEEAMAIAQRELVSPLATVLRGKPVDKA